MHDKQSPLVLKVICKYNIHILKPCNFITEEEDVDGTMISVDNSGFINFAYLKSTFDILNLNYFMSYIVTKCNIY